MIQKIIVAYKKRIILIPAIIVVAYMIYVGVKICEQPKGDLEKIKKEMKICEQPKGDLEKIKKEDVKLYLITPTYARFTQKVDLTSLSQTLMHVKNIQWIVVEDSKSTTLLVKKLLLKSGINFTLLSVTTKPSMKQKPRQMGHRGIAQRNLALSWIRQNTHAGSRGVVYFADDDNKYSLELFEEMRQTKLVSIWPVAFCANLRWEGPICQNGTVISFFTSWRPDRIFPVDMAAFAFNVSLLHKYLDAHHDESSTVGFLETDFLSKQLHLSPTDLEARARDCHEILVWHTSTNEPSLVGEKRFPSDPSLEI